MRLSHIALAALAAGTHAFKDTSPFVLFSSSPSPNFLDASSSQLQLSSEVLQNAKESLKACDSELYYVITQPEISSLELGGAPHLRTALKSPGVRSRFTVSEVVGFNGGEGEELVKWIEETCGAVRSHEEVLGEAMKGRVGKAGVVVGKKFRALTSRGAEREEMLGDHDTTLYSLLLKDLPKGVKYTIIYLTTPSTAEVSIPSNENAVLYQPHFDDVVHMDLKRNLQIRKGNASEVDQRPLFEKYQFLSPGIFMGILVTIILLMILSVGISAVSSLQVSYGAFDKEMGPAAQKKLQ